MFFVFWCKTMLGRFPPSVLFTHSCGTICPRLSQFLVTYHFFVFFFSGRNILLGMCSCVTHSFWLCYSIFSGPYSLADSTSSWIHFSLQLDADSHDFVVWIQTVVPPWRSSPSGQPPKELHRINTCPVLSRFSSTRMICCVDSVRSEIDSKNTQIGVHHPKYRFVQKPGYPHSSGSRSQ